MSFENSIASPERLALLVEKVDTLQALLDTQLAEKKTLQQILELRLEALEQAKTTLQPALHSTSDIDSQIIRLSEKVDRLERQQQWFFKLAWIILAVCVAPFLFSMMIKLLSSL
jgi:CHASE3 domain sensor protein